MSDIRAAVEEAARRGLDPTEVLGVGIEPALGSDGDDLLRVTIVVPDDGFDGIDGSHFLATLLRVRDGLRIVGDDRRAVVEYLTPSEMAADGDPE